MLALLGASGSGKTTLLRSVAGLNGRTKGRIEIRGKVVFDAATGFEVPAEQRGLGLVFQSYAIWPHRTCFRERRLWPPLAPRCKRGGSTRKSVMF